MKPEIIAGTKLQIWQEIMRQSQHDVATGQTTYPDPEQAASKAERIYNKLCAGVTAAPARKR